MDLGMVFENSRTCEGERGHVLRIFKDGYPLAVLMSVYVFETFQHLVALDVKASIPIVVVRKHGCPHRMRMHHGGCSGGADHFEMQQRFGRWSAGGTACHVPLAVDFQNLSGIHPSFVDGTGGDGETQRLAGKYRAEVAARSKHPASSVEVGSETDKFFGGIG